MNRKKKLLLVLLLIFPILITNTREVSYSLVYEEVSQLDINKIDIEIKKSKMIKLLMAMIQVESLGNDKAIGDLHLGKEYAVGALQIRPVMVREVNRILRLQHKNMRFKLKDRFSRDKSIQMFTIWKNFHHPDDDFEKIARNWNGGPEGYLRNSTVKYWVKIQNELNR